MKKRELEVARLKHDILAYRLALGYSAPAHHDGRLSDGTTPKCGFCTSQYTIAAKQFYDRSHPIGEPVEPCGDCDMCRASNCPTWPAMDSSGEWIGVCADCVKLISKRTL